MNIKVTKTATEAILDWFERNPTAKARSGPIGKALKMDSAKCAEALSRLAQPGGQLLRARVEVGAKDRQPGAPKEQWEYCLAMGGKVPEPVKPYKAPAAYRRPTTQPVVDSPVLVKTKSPAPPAIPAGADETGEPAKKIVTTTIDIKITDLPEYQAAVAQFEAALREAQISAAEWQKKYEDALQAAGAVTAVAATREPAGYVVARPKKPLRRFSKLGSAQSIALGAVRAGSRAEVFALYPTGKAVPAAEWRDCQSGNA